MRNQKTSKVVLQGSNAYVFGVKVETVKLIGGRCCFGAMSGRNEHDERTCLSKFNQIMAILTPPSSLEGSRSIIEQHE